MEQETKDVMCLRLIYSMIDDKCTICENRYRARKDAIEKAHGILAKIKEIQSK